MLGRVSRGELKQATVSRIDREASESGVFSPSGYLDRGISEKDSTKILGAVVSYAKLLDQSRLIGPGESTREFSVASDSSVLVASSALSRYLPSCVS